MTKPVQFILPFKVVMQPMKGLLVATFKGDPEFESLEPQIFDDPMNGKGMRCLPYRLARVEHRVEVELDVTEHWKPNNLPLGMNMLTRLMRMFRAWPAAYRWRRTVDLGDSPLLETWIPFALIFTSTYVTG